jgi:serine/threonine-protein phosphatase 2A regulatory subunit A
MSSQSFDALELLRDELCETDLQVQSEAMKRLHLVARALGPSRARDELIPYLKHLCSSKIEGKMDGKLEDELLMLLAVEVKSLPPFLGGPDHSHLLLSGILDTLCAADETVVREKAVESLNHVISIMPESTVSDLVLGPTGVIRSLSDAEKSFQCHISCAGLLAVSYRRASAVIRPSLRNILKQLALDEMPLVRAAVFVALGDVAAEMEPAHLIPEIVVLFETLSKDHQEIVRETAIDVLLKLAALTASGIPVSSISEALSSIPYDRSVKLRSDLAKSIVQFSRHLGLEVSQSSLFPLFMVLVRDQDADVRALAACNIGDFALSLESQSLAEQLAVAARALSTDASIKVKLELSVGIGALASALGSSGTMVHLVPVINTLLADEQASIKDKAIRSVHKVFVVCGTEILDSPFFQTVMKMQKDPQWRVRHALLEFLPEVAPRVLLADFDLRFTNLLREFMSDRCSLCPALQPLFVLLFIFVCSPKFCCETDFCVSA